jgi:single-strand selective monofunctional uracil DNA glycosylase
VTRLRQISRSLCDEVDALAFGPPTTHVYNPLRYARAPHELFLERFGEGEREVLLVGMNPGPFGMAQTGVPFGDVGLVRDWMGIEAEVGSPANPHPKRPIDGFACPRSEVSGSRLWGWARDRFGTAEAFFARFFVTNYCPLVFMEASSRNRTPDKLPRAERVPLYAACDRALRDIVAHVRPRVVLGVGKFGDQRAREALADMPSPPEIGWILHPSPASPRANRGWAEQAEADLRRHGVTLSS